MPKWKFGFFVMSLVSLAGCVSYDEPTAEEIASRNYLDPTSASSAELCYQSNQGNRGHYFDEHLNQWVNLSELRSERERRNLGFRNSLEYCDNIITSRESNAVLDEICSDAGRLDLSHPNVGLCRIMVGTLMNPGMIGAMGDMDSMTDILQNQSRIGSGIPEYSESMTCFNLYANTFTQYRIVEPFVEIQSSEYAGVTRESLTSWDSSSSQYQFVVPSMLGLVEVNLDFQRKIVVQYDTINGQSNLNCV